MSEFRSLPTGLTSMAGLVLVSTASAQTSAASIKDINPGWASSSPGYFTEVGKLLFFRASDPQGGAGTYLYSASSLGSQVGVRELSPCAKSRECVPRIDVDMPDHRGGVDDSRRRL